MHADAKLTTYKELTDPIVKPDAEYPDWIWTVGDKVDRYQMEKIYEAKYKGRDVIDIPLRFAKKALKLDRKAKIKAHNEEKPR